MSTPNPESIKEFERLIKSYVWKSDPKIFDNAGMKKMYADDRKGFRKILSLYKKGKWPEALEAALELDTFPRECIPGSIWLDINTPNR